MARFSLPIPSGKILPLHAARRGENYPRLTAGKHAREAFKQCFMLGCAHLTVYTHEFAVSFVNTFVDKILSIDIPDQSFVFRPSVRAQTELIVNLC